MSSRQPSAARAERGDSYPLELGSLPDPLLEAILRRAAPADDVTTAVRVERVSSAWNRAAKRAREDPEVSDGDDARVGGARAFAWGHAVGAPDARRPVPPGRVGPLVRLEFAAGNGPAEATRDGRAILRFAYGGALLAVHEAGRTLLPPRWESIAGPVGGGFPIECSGALSCAAGLLFAYTRETDGGGWAYAYAAGRPPAAAVDGEIAWTSSVNAEGVVLRAGAAHPQRPLRDLEAGVAPCLATILDVPGARPIVPVLLERYAPGHLYLDSLLLVDLAPGGDPPRRVPLAGPGPAPARPLEAVAAGEPVHALVGPDGRVELTSESWGLPGGDLALVVGPGYAAARVEAPRLEAARAGYAVERARDGAGAWEVVRNP